MLVISIIVKGILVRDCKGIERLRIIKDRGRINHQ
jgi:hypothetical protein